jgi:hypothetical protein
VFVILAYAPILLFLPLLLLAGVVFVVVPGGFIIVLGGLYYAATGFAGFLGVATTGPWRTRASRVRQANTTVARRSPSGHASLDPRRAIAPVAVPITTDRVVRPAPSLVTRPRGSNGIYPGAPLHRGSAPDREDGARPCESSSVAEVLPPTLGRTPPPAPGRKGSLARPSSSGSESRA